MALQLQVVVDCARPGALAQFWAGALGYVVEPPPPGFASWPETLTAWGVPESEWDSRSAVVDPDGEGPRIFFQRVPEPKTVKNRLHLDVRAAPRGTPPDERRALVDGLAERLVAAGAARVRTVEEGPDYFHVLTDPEGNEFDAT